MQVKFCQFEIGSCIKVTLLHGTAVLSGIIGENSEENMKSENTLRKALARKGFKLVTTNSYVQYGVRIKKYAVADANNVIVSGENMDLSDVEEWLRK